MSATGPGSGRCQPLGPPVDGSYREHLANISRRSRRTTSLTLATESYIGQWAILSKVCISAVTAPQALDDSKPPTGQLTRHRIPSCSSWPTPVPYPRPGVDMRRPWSTPQSGSWWGQSSRSIRRAARGPDRCCARPAARCGPRDAADLGPSVRPGPNGALGRFPPQVHPQ